LFHFQKKKKSFTLQERRLALISFIYIARNIEKKWLIQWFKKENSMTTFESFLDLLSLALDIFQVHFIYSFFSFLFVSFFSFGKK